MIPGGSTACFGGIKLLVSNPIESQPITRRTRMT